MWESLQAKEQFKKTHKNSYKPYECDMCEKSFSNGGHLTFLRFFGSKGRDDDPLSVEEI